MHGLCPSNFIASHQRQPLQPLALCETDLTSRILQSSKKLQPPVPPSLPPFPGLGIGFRGGHGIVLARLPPLTATGPPRWSAPIFVKVRCLGLWLAHQWQCTSCHPFRASLLWHCTQVWVPVQGRFGSADADACPCRWRWASWASSWAMNRYVGERPAAC